MHDWGEPERAYISELSTVCMFACVLVMHGTSVKKWMWLGSVCVVVMVVAKRNLER